jgi:hypothetical protein
MGVHMITISPCRVLNPLSSNVNCSQELADYPLLGRALPLHKPLATTGGSSSSSSSVGIGVSSSACFVDLANSIQPGILPAATDDAVWQKLVDGNFPDASTGMGSRLLLGTMDVGLNLAQRLGGIWLVRKATAALPQSLAFAKWCQPPYTIDAESIRLGPEVEAVARVMKTTPEWLLKDR